MKLGHIALRVKNINTMLEFYCYGMGFQEAFRINNDDGSLRIVYVHVSDGQYLELCLGGTDRPDFNDQETMGFRHVCFIVKNLADTKTEIESRGITFSSQILNMRDHNLAAFLTDPEGNKIELVQTGESSPQFAFAHKL